MEAIGSPALPCARRSSTVGGPLCKGDFKVEQAGWTSARQRELALYSPSHSSASRRVPLIPYGGEVIMVVVVVVVVVVAVFRGFVRCVALRLYYS